MMKMEKKDRQILLVQLAAWAVILITPMLAVLFTSFNIEATLRTGIMVLFTLFSPLVLYFLNFYVFEPFLFYKRRFFWFTLANLVVIAILNFGVYHMFSFMASHNMPLWWKIDTLLRFFVHFLLIFATITLAIGIRHFLRVRRIKQQLEEEKAKSMEAELAWLKSQINPHFLFNTLNNISSLVQIDPDASQDAIAQLSDLLRYAMYETQKPHVSLAGEVEFMKNYVELMRLRCNEKTTITTRFDVPSHMEVAPLLFISLIENAFKHGVSNTKTSFIDISLTMEDGLLTFICDNSNHPKDEKDRSGSGIGIENTRRRLNLLYKDNHQWEQTLEDDIYHVKITLKP